MRYMDYRDLDSALYRLKDILGDPHSDPPVQPLIPVSKSTWYSGIRAGRFPPPVCGLGKRIAAWRFRDIKALLEGNYSRSRSEISHKSRREIHR
jgi:prophage regulatory protein